MLATATPFPQVGSFGFLAETAQPCRILQRLQDGRLLIAITCDRYPSERASGNRTVDAATVLETREEALGRITRRRPRGRARRQG